MSSPSNHLGGQEIARTAFKGAVAIVGLLIARFIAGRLPMIADSSPVLISALLTQSDSLVKPVAIARTVIDTAIFAILIVTTRDLKPKIAGLATRLPAAGLMVFLAVVIAVVTIAYSSYQPVLSALIGDHDIYDWAFLAGGLAAVGALVFVVYQNLDAITDIAFRSGTQTLHRDDALSPATSPPIPTVCATCGTVPAPGARFCGNCGRPYQNAGESK